MTEPNTELPRLAPGTYQLIKRIVVNDEGVSTFVDEPGGEYIQGFWHKTATGVRPVIEDAGKVDELVAVTIRTAFDEWKASSDPFDHHSVNMPEYVRRALADAGLLAPAHLTHALCLKWDETHNGFVILSDGAEAGQIVALNDALQQVCGPELERLTAERDRLKDALEKQQALLSAARDVLERVGCQFDMCTGVTIAPVDMQTCFVCEFLGRSWADQGTPGATSEAALHVHDHYECDHVAVPDDDHPVPGGYLCGACGSKDFEGDFCPSRCPAGDPFAMNLRPEGLRPSGSEAAEPQTGVELIAAERARQIAQEHRSPEHDDEHSNGALARSGADTQGQGRSQRTELSGAPCGKTGLNTPEVCDGTCTDCVDEHGPGVSGEADTSPQPRAWEHGDRVYRPAWGWTGTVREAAPERDRYSVQWDHLLDRPGLGGSSLCNAAELTEVLPEVSSSQEGDDRG